ncbi:hypothetical protein C1645_849187 [Glomus cerebriforme]|uniref:SAM domain-containing protein n=1 Tax=Glomus cerebriforme TaxID=658196 RepID=A0A397TJY1_9GLOM|nr:hypothetical protein C1645_849187 [Glomus cerebriforme]
MKYVASTLPTSENIAIEEFKFKLIVKKKNGSLLPAKWITIQEKEFEDFLLSLKVSVQGLLGDDSVNNEDFNIAYKQLNSNGLETHLEDENDFKEFINEYSDIVNHKKSMALYITMKEIMLKKRRKENEQKENETSDSEFVDVEIIDNSKKNKNKIPKTLDLDDSQVKKTQVITELREKYHCFSHQLPCIIRDRIHKKLTYTHLELWSTEIVKGFTTIDEPPTYPIFRFDQKKHSTSQHIQVNLSELSQVFCPLYQPNPVYQYYAPNMYQNYAPTLVAADTNVDVNNSYANIKKNISIQEFFENLDKRFGDKVFLIYLDNFLEQCIEVQHIPELGDEEFISLGITKIGHKKTLIMEAKKYI